jgi:transposase
MSKTYLPYDVEQRLLLPPNMRDWLPEGHLALFVLDVVRTLDLSAIRETYEQGDGRGRPPYHPVMMVALLIYAYCTGKPSSRKIERATYEDVAFRVLSGDRHPDHDSIAEFRRRHLQALAGLFVQVLKLCEKAGLVKLGHVALDGTKIKANASKHKAQSYERMCETEKKLDEEVKKLLTQAESTDAEEDESFGKGRRGDELPQELQRRESRLIKIREAKAALEQEARERAQREAEQARAKIAEREKQDKETGEKPKGPSPKVPDPEQAKPDSTAQRNFTDPESRIMKDGATKSFEQAYNAQIAVDAEAQIIVASAVTQEANDKHQLVPMLEKVEQNLGRMPEKATADAGYFSEANVTDSTLQTVDLYVPPNRQKHGELIPVTAPAADQPTESSSADRMRQKLKTRGGHDVYKMRKAIVEPVFGQTKDVRGFRRFSFRGLIKVGAEWDVVCLTHNLLKLFRSHAQLLAQ